MSAAPVPAGEFDWKDPEQLEAMYRWAKSGAKLSSYLAQYGVTVSPSSITYYVKKYGIEIANPAYRKRTMSQPVEEITEADRAHAAKDLLDYFKSRTVPQGRPPITKPSRGKYAVEVIGSDLHAPLHHEAAWEVFLSACEQVQPDGITLNGDVLDLAMISRFVKKPSAVRQIQVDLDWARENVFARINTVCPNAVKTFVLGNHEGERWERYLWERCPEISELRCLDMEALLGLTELGWRYEPDGYELIPDTFVVDHGSRHTSAMGGGSAMSARKEMIDVGLSGISGHTHKLGKFYRYDNAGYRVWMEGGCLCDQEKMREHRVTAHKRGPKKEDWHLGFGVVHHLIGDSAFYLADVPILTKGARAFAMVPTEHEEIAA